MTSVVHLAPWNRFVSLSSSSSSFTSSFIVSQPGSSSSSSFSSKSMTETNENSKEVKDVVMDAVVSGANKPPSSSDLNRMCEKFECLKIFPPLGLRRAPYPCLTRNEKGVIVVFSSRGKVWTFLFFLCNRNTFLLYMYAFVYRVPGC